MNLVSILYLKMKKAAILSFIFEHYCKLSNNTSKTYFDCIYYIFYLIFATFDKIKKIIQNIQFGTTTIHLNEM